MGQDLAHQPDEAHDQELEQEPPRRPPPATAPPREQTQQADQIAELQRRQDALAERQEQQQQQLRMLAAVQAASERMRQCYHRVGESLRNAFGPFKAAYDQHQGALARHSQRLDAQRALILDLFFVGLGGGLGGALQQTIRGTGPLRDSLMTVARGTAAGDIVKYVTRLTPRAAPATQTPGQRTPGQAPTTQAPATQAPATQAPAAGPTAQPQASARAPVANAPATAEPVTSNLDPETWLQTTLAALDRVGGDVSEKLTQLCTALARDMQPPAGEDPIAFVARLIEPVESLMTLPVRQREEYALLIWTRWLNESWLAETARDNHRENVDRIQARDRALLREVAVHCGTREPVDKAIAAALARTRSNREAQFDVPGATSRRELR